MIYCITEWEFCQYVPTRVNFLRFFGLKIDLFAALYALAVFGGRAEDNVAGGVDCSFKGVLNNADDKANRNNLHCHILTDSEK